MNVRGRLGSIRTLPRSLALVVNGKEYSWVIDDYQESARAWDVTMGFYPTARHRC